MRTLTFLFSDLRDYTAFVERHGDVAATTLIADYRRLVRAEVAKAKGAEVKTEGDSFYVVFEGAGDAVRCAVSVLREADRYSRDRPDRPMRVGIGIHAGEPQPHEGQYVGGAVIVAARLAQASGAGELLVSDVVRGLLPKGTAPAMQERQGLVLKGIADAPRAFSVSWTSAEPEAAAEPRVTVVEAAAPTDRSMLCPRVIGRESELAALRAFLGEAAAGQGRTVLIAGEAGVGKTATLRTFLEHAAAENARVLRGECSEVEARRPRVASRSRKRRPPPHVEGYRNGDPDSMSALSFRAAPTPVDPSASSRVGAAHRRPRTRTKTTGPKRITARMRTQSHSTSKTLEVDRRTNNE